MHNIVFWRNGVSLLMTGLTLRRSGDPENTSFLEVAGNVSKVINGSKIKGSNEVITLFELHCLMKLYFKTFSNSISSLKYTIDMIELLISSYHQEI